MFHGLSCKYSTDVPLQLLFVGIPYTSASVTSTPITRTPEINHTYSRYIPLVQPTHRFCIQTNHRICANSGGSSVQYSSIERISSRVIGRLRNILLPLLVGTYVADATHIIASIVIKRNHTISIIVIKACFILFIKLMCGIQITTKRPICS